MIKNIMIAGLLIFWALPAGATIEQKSVAAFAGDQLQMSPAPVRNANEAQWWNFFKKKHSQKIWKGVHPDLKMKLEAVYEAMAQRGYDMRPLEGVRSEARQAALLASNTGVTSVGAGMSCHNHGYAIDSVMHVDGKPTWDIDNAHVREGYLMFGELTQALGLEWGGSWTRIQDYPHVEMKVECRQAIRAYRIGKKPPIMVASLDMADPALVIAAHFNSTALATICTFDQPCESQFGIVAQMCPSPVYQYSQQIWSKNTYLNWV